ncbi:MAG: LON peptidase substrate-binding domain-containing protein [Mycobacterium sp.]
MSQGSVAAIPMFSLESAMLPGEELPLRIFEPRYSALVRDTLDRDDKSFGVVLIARGREVGGGDERHDVGVRAKIAAFEDFGDGKYRLRCRLTERIRVREWLPDDPYPRAVVEPWPDETGPVRDGSVAEIEERIWGLFERIATAKDARLPQRTELLGDGQDVPAGRRLYELAGRMPMGTADKYSILAAPSPADRLAALTDAIDTVTAMVEFQLAGE